MSCSSSCKQLAHLRIPLEEILSATNNFSDANLIRKYSFGTEYTGRLLRSGQLVHTVARRYEHGNKEFWREVSMLSRLEHQNIVSIVGFCDENGEKIVIIKDDESTRGNLYQHLRDPSLMTWMRRLEICVGVAKALSYIHYDEGRDFSDIHRDIKSRKILLDGQWKAKLCGFELSMTQAAAERNCPCHCQLANVCGTPGYIDPTYAKTGSVSHKSDVFSLGVVLFEVLCAKSAKEPVKEDEMYLYQSAKSHYREGRLYDLVHPGLGKQMGPQSFKIISETAYSCLNEQPLERPSIDQIVIQLEKALESQREHEKVDVFKKQFAHLQIPLEEIVSATDNFSYANLIGYDGFRKVYQGQLLRSGQLVDIVARRFLDKRFVEGKKQFWREVSMLSRLEHQNIVSIVGFCDENGDKIVIINNHETTHGSLLEYLRDPSLTWMQRLHICVGVARALRYIHYDEGRDFSVIHRDIKSSRILLDDHWEPKLSGFGVSISQKTAERNRPCELPDDVYDSWITEEYCDPRYYATGIVSHKSDMFSLGVVLFELLCGKGTSTVLYDDHLLIQSAISHFEGGTLYDLVTPGLGKQMCPQSFGIFSETAYCCLNDEPSERPSIDQIVIQLEKALESQHEHENNLISNAYTMVEGPTSTTFKDLFFKP